MKPNRNTKADNGTSSEGIVKPLLSRRIVGLQVEKPTRLHIGYYDECKALCGQKGAMLEGEIIIEAETFYYKEQNVDMPKKFICKKCLSIYDV